MWIVIVETRTAAVRLQEVSRGSWDSGAVMATRLITDRLRTVSGYPSPCEQPAADGAPR